MPFHHLLLMAGPLFSGQGQETPDRVTFDWVQAQLQAFEEGTVLDEPEQESIREQYLQARSILEQSREAIARAEDFRRQAAEAPALLAAIRAELATPPGEARPEAPEDAAPVQVEQWVTRAQAELEAARQLANQLGTEPDRRAERRGSLAEELARIGQELSVLDEELLAAQQSDDGTESARVRRVLLLARREVARRRLAAAEAESASYDARVELLPLRRERASRQVSQAERTAAAWQQIASERRALEAERSAQEMKRLAREAARQHETLRAFAEETEDLGALRTGPTGLNQAIDRVTRELTELRDVGLPDLQARLRSVRRKVEAGGPTGAMGLLLRREFEALPHARTLRRQHAKRQADIGAAQYQLILLEERQQESADLDQQLHELMAEVGAPQAAPELVEGARELIQARQELVRSLIGDCTTHLDRLIELDARSREHAAAAGRYRVWIGERILWVRSVGEDRLLDLSAVGAAAAWLVSPDAWAEGVRATLEEARRSWLPLLAMLLTAASSWILLPRARKATSRLAASTTRYTTDTFGLTVRASAWTLLAAFPLPATLGTASWLLQHPADQAAAPLAVGAGLGRVAWLLLVLLFARAVLAPRGLAEDHFRWQARSVRTLDRHLRWFTPLAGGCVFLMTAMARQSQESWHDSLGRLAFLVGAASLAAFNHRVLRPDGPVLAEYLQLQATGMITRTRLLWFGAAVWVPIALAGLAAAGFYYTALELFGRLETSIALALALVLANAFLTRWLFISRREIAIEKARQRREELQREIAADGETTRDAPRPIEESELDVPALDAQSRQLFRRLSGLAVLVGLYLIWAPVFPALRALERVQIWPTLGVAAPESPQTLEGEEIQEEAPRSSAPDLVTMPLRQGGLPMTPRSGAQSAEAAPVTLLQLVLALLILALTFAAAGNLPGMLEIILLRHLPLDAGARYAATTIARYLIAIFGVSFAFGAVGIGWSNIQWLAAALTFGLAFGLQEVFANFVSGLILFFERPFRVGDIVRVGATEGRVTRIRMRATTILDWDRRELLVPNKDFITGQLVNLTLSDEIVREIIQVGVAYGSDTREVQRILLEIAQDNPYVLDLPKPRALFWRFGESALDFELRVFMANRDLWPKLVHTLHDEIHRRFAKAGIEIAFPQRDLHIRTPGGAPDPTGEPSRGTDPAE